MTAWLAMNFFSLRHIKSNSKLKGNLTKSCFKRQRTGIPDAIVKSLLSMPDGCLTVKRNFPKILIHSHQLPPFVYQSVTGPFVKESRLLIITVTEGVKMKDT